MILIEKFLSIGFIILVILNIQTIEVSGSDSVRSNLFDFYKDRVQTFANSPEIHKNDMDLVIHLVQHNREHLNCVLDKYGDNPHFFWALIEAGRGGFVRHIGPALQNNPEFITKSLKLDARVLGFLPNRYKENIEFLLNFVNENTKKVKIIFDLSHDSIKRDRNFIEGLLKANPGFYNHIYSDELQPAIDGGAKRALFDLAIDTIKQGEIGYDFKCIELSPSTDIHYMKELIKYGIRSISELELKCEQGNVEHEAILAEIVRECPLAYEKLGDEFRKTILIAVAAFKGDENNIQFIPVEILENEKFLRMTQDQDAGGAVDGNKGARSY